MEVRLSRTLTALACFTVGTHLLVLGLMAYSVHMVLTSAAYWSYFLAWHGTSGVFWKALQACGAGIDVLLPALPGLLILDLWVILRLLARAKIAQTACWSFCVTLVICAGTLALLVAVNTPPRRRSQFGKRTSVRPVHRRG
jgi:hypothetical protein